jgi:chromate transporter
MIYFQLFFEFFKTGLFAVGGGLATIPFLREIAEKYDWYTQNELTLMIAISESTPGPLGINMATYAGFSTAGILGGLIATLALVLPSVIIVLIVSKFMKRYGESRITQGMFWVLRPSAVGLIAAATGTLLMLSITNAGVIEPVFTGLYLIITTLCFINEYKKINIHPIAFIAVGAVAGIIIC